jgi:hypothetical protein
MQPPEAPKDVLRALSEEMQLAYAALRTAGLSLSLARGKPSAEQAALSDSLLTVVMPPEDCISEDGTDCRNYYGDLRGLIEARRLFGPILGAPPEQTLVANNSSLALMHDAIVFGLLKGVQDGAAPWGRDRAPISFLCPSPGYYRHLRSASSTACAWLRCD